MSKALLKMSLEIVESGLEKTPGKQKKNTKKGVMSSKPKSRAIHKKQKGNKSNDVLGLRTKPKRSYQQVKNSMKQNDTQIEENLKRLQQLTGAVLDTETAEKLFRRAKTGKYVGSIEQKAAKKEESVFTEDDFKKFEAEFFCS